MSPQSKLREVRPGPRQSSAADGTIPLLKGGVWTLAAGIVCAVAIRLFFGGMDEHGPHTNMGWLLLIVAMMCLPFGSMIFLLGAAKWLRNRRLDRS